MKNLSLFCLLVFIYHVLPAQQIKLYEPFNYREALENGTRSRDGNPGPNYWQNHADYKINVRLDTAENKIYGQETVTYYNESPDTIKYLFLRLYPNTYKKGMVRNLKRNQENIHSGMNIDTMAINGEPFVLDKDNSYVHGTNLMLLGFEKPIVPGGELSFYCEWDYPIPTAEEKIRRTGRYNENSYFIGYFYPQIAVYDDLEKVDFIKGWDASLFFQGLQDFYNDFNNYEVTIEVPENYFVWATGTLQNADEIYSESLLQRINKARRSSEKVQILAEEHFSDNLLKSNIWKFKAESVPDFGFGVARDYLWEGTTVEVDGRPVFVDVAYDQNSQMFNLALEIAANSVKYASEVFPAIPYPYEHATTFNGNSSIGMEFPMIANNSPINDSIAFKAVTFHEIFHNYTPFMLGFNEKRYPFMDEGLTEFFERNFLKSENDIEPTKLIDSYNREMLNHDSPLMFSFERLNELNFYYYGYVKPVVAYDLFANMIGKKNFKLVFQEFARRWEGKHPTPYDFFYTFNDYLGVDYNWYWRAWFFDLGYPDLGIRLEEDKVIVSRVGVGSLPLPIVLDLELENGTNYTIERSMEVWKDGAKSIEIELEDVESIVSIKLNHGITPDIDMSNNLVKVGEDSSP